MKYAFAGDRDISCEILRFIISKGFKPEALLVSNGENASHNKDLIAISGLEKEKIFFGDELKQDTAVSFLKSLELDYIFGIHFPYIIPKKVLNIPKIGFLNLHPAYLPYNKGWHTPSWAIIEKTKYGATLHYMSERLDEGDIIHQKELIVQPFDTANKLYQKVLSLEKEVFIEAFDNLKSLKPISFKQKDDGTAHTKKDLKIVQEIKLDQTYTGQEVINLLRGLTTNKIEEGAYFNVENKRYYLQLCISKPYKNQN